MTALPDFQLEAFFSRWEFAARYHLTASDAETLSLAELLDLASPEDRAAFEGLRLTYTETFGAPDLREAIAATYDHRAAADILCFAGAEEGIYAAMRVMLSAGDHAIVVTPNYQAAETVPLAICAVTGVPLDPDHGWTLDIDRVAAAIRPETRLVSINFPHNPTGKILERDRFDALIELCRRHGLWLFSDEVYRPLGREGVNHLPQVADVYERGLSLGVMSKAYGLPGLRIGWIACADRDLLGRLERYKHYLSICNAGPSERLALIALKARAPILARNCALVTRNLALFDTFFAERPDLFSWQRPDGGCVGYPRYLGTDGVGAFAERLVEEAGVLVLPSDIYRSALGPTPHDRFRVGFGRAGIETGLTAFRTHLAKYY
ncbi:aminotransferase class I/II-fold pyridoxal phosphate-dependent enzyme [Sphingomonas sp. AR_OL41]|uniref:aminotransferase class I/II-fold pyridoxal phosphate-dependent enzyme n=1 Tax=Sphingomonas sp. AR_OL41 TaxID=3042729 RepID=UPI00247FC4EC|nr:aminotransferase class I/II-fold pyridoxal phosphate-dependent enzyme [Sphingomonas sp. AR_OL41]MDH7970832.1 aminotransferase class I/II-fold pyridoxal phosphate-dependent enzyme [Sphingomonas sp. AR_OL41]